MDGSDSESTIINSDESNRTIRRNNIVENTNNRLIIPNESSDISNNNSIINSGNTIEIVGRVNNYNISNLRINNTITPTPLNSINSPSSTSLTSSISQAVERERITLENQDSQRRNLPHSTSTSNLLNTNNFNRNCLNLRKFKSVIDLKNKLVDLFTINKHETIKKSFIDYPFTNDNIFKLPNNIYLQLLESSKELNIELLNNS
jgi:hypothetical protein